MKKENENEFTEELISCLGDDRAKLIDKSVPIQLLIHEIELIEWALTAFESRPVTSALYEACASIDWSEIKKEERAQLHEEIDSAFDRAENCKRLIRRLLFKISEAIDIAVQKADSQRDLL